MDFGYWLTHLIPMILDALRNLVDLVLTGIHLLYVYITSLADVFRSFADIFNLLPSLVTDFFILTFLVSTFIVFVNFFRGR